MQRVDSRPKGACDVGTRARSDKRGSVPADTGLRRQTQTRADRHTAATTPPDTMQDRSPCRRKSRRDD